MITKINAPIGILGGTFDPIHLGHTQLAQTILEQLNLAEIRFIPNYQPPHRNLPVASADQRLALVKIALKDNPKFIADDREIKRQGISYTIDTLKSLRKDFPDTPLCWIMGLDELVKLNTWHRWQELIQYVNFIIVNRPNINLELPIEIKELFQKHVTPNHQELHQHLSGKIFQLQIPPFAISATEIRKQLSQHQKPENVLAEKVYDHIKKEQLYEM